MDSRLTLPSGFYGNQIANVYSARELAMLPNGDLLVGTEGQTIDIVPNADAAGITGSPQVFITLSEGPATSIAVGSDGSLYAGTNTTVWKIPYKTGDRSEPTSSAVAIAHVRTGPVSGTDGDNHKTTIVAVSGSTLYIGVGSSCNACVETDTTRATVLKMSTSGGSFTNLTTRSRNPMALAIDPATGSLWIGGAGQDGLPYTHPYEYFDSPTLRGSSNVDYGWPQCEEDRVPYNALGTNPAPNCANTVAPKIEFPAYATLIGATFYPANQSGAYVTSHGSWHCCPATTPRVYYVPMSGDTPLTPVNWSDPTVQSQSFVSGYGTSSSTSYIGRPTGVAVGIAGSLFLADDFTGNIYRIRHH
jgi:glucose/arabinose dehydrogenase